MKKLYNIIFPIWLLILIPPVIFFIIPANFIIDSIVLLICFSILKIKHIKQFYMKSIIKVCIIGFLADLIGASILLLSQFLGFNTFLTNYLLNPITWNPFETIYAFLYVLIAVFISGYLIYIWNKKYTFTNINISNYHKHLISLILAITTAPYLFFLPSKWFYHQYFDTLPQQESIIVIGEQNKNTIC